MLRLCYSLFVDYLEDIMQIKYKKKGEELTIYLYGELDEYSAQKAKTLLETLINENLNSSIIIFDLSGLSFMDSTGIGLLIGRYKKLKQFNIPCFISGASVNIERVIELAGLYGIMPKY